MNKETKQNADANYNYYRENYNEIYKLYCGEYIIIQDSKIVFNNIRRTVVTEHADTLEAGTYIILKI